MLLTQGLHALARRQEMLCTLNFFFFFLIDSHDQLLTELKIKINLDNIPTLQGKLQRDV